MSYCITDELTPDIVIVEIRGGVVVDVHNTPNGFLIFDFDTAEDPAELETELKAAIDYLETGGAA